MKILIIGSEGFIGGHLKRFFSSKHEVFSADIIQLDRSQNYFKLAAINSDYEVVFNKMKFDVCINASGNGSVPISLTKPVFDFELNVTNTIKILDAIRVHNPECKYINLSSAAVYGNPVKLPIKETADLKPLSPYGWHKLYAEQICKEYFYLYNIQTINLRLFSVYGERLKKQIFWDLYQKCLHSNEIELFGSGTETRDFIYISDVINAIDCIIKDGLFNGEAVNIASGLEIEIKKAALVFINEHNSDVKLKFNMIVKPGDPIHWRADISLLESFGFKFQVSIQEGLKNVVQWLKESN
ncbi:MAG: NAD-dependent epimerase/dehydratase family protein [Weeksellaceae bacterium]|nr:NAD-dependent epimerase/dehydratase family protein [Weeksellaceae bacterium]